MPRPPTTPSPPVGPFAARLLARLPAGWSCLLILATVLVAYLPALAGGFIWDDPGHVTRADLRDLAGLGRIWCEVGATQQYYPVLHSAFWLEYWIWGDLSLIHI